MTCCELMLSSVSRASPERNKFRRQSDMFSSFEEERNSKEPASISPWESRREDDVRTLPTKSYCFRCMWQNNRFTYKTFQDGRKIVGTANAFELFFLSAFAFTRFRLLYLSFERRHLAKPFKSHYSFVLQLILDSHWIFMILWVVEHFFFLVA